jgi:predicted FMN-binding regulatory protein PaiB
MFNFIQRFEAVLFKLCDVAKILQRFTNSATTRLQNYLNSRTPKAFLEIILKFRITRENIKVRFTLEQDMNDQRRNRVMSTLSSASAL